MISNFDTGMLVYDMYKGGFRSENSLNVVGFKTWLFVKSSHVGGWVQAFFGRAYPSLHEGCGKKLIISLAN